MVRLLIAFLLSFSFFSCQAGDSSQQNAEEEDCAVLQKMKESAKEGRQEKSNPQAKDAPEGKKPSLFGSNLLNFDETRLISVGEIDPKTFKRIMGKRKSTFKVCYKKALKANPKARGVVTVSFNISPTGRVSTVKIKQSTLHHEEAEACIIRTIRRIMFPPLESKQRVSVEYPLSFTP